MRKYQQLVRLGAALVLAGCAAQVEGGEVEGDVALADEALTVFTPVRFDMMDSYYGTSSSGTSCSSSYKKDISGNEPAEAGTYPVAVFLTGTGGTWNAASAMKFTEEMAKRGFVAATVEYANGNYPSCTTMEARAKCLFQGSVTTSAIAKLCARPKADCNKGFVTSGISQGSDLASLAKDYDSRARAAYLISNVLAPSIMNNKTCLQDSATVFTPSQVRAISGSNDEMCTGTSDVRAELNLGTGRSCGSTVFNCLQADGSGWYMVQPSQLQDGAADHCWILNNGCSGTTSDNNYANGTDVWSSKSNYDWLSSRVTH